MSFLENRRRRPLHAIRAGNERSALVDDHMVRHVPPDGPGLALAVVRSGAVVHLAGYGLADLRRNAAVSPDTLFHLASCGKQFTGLGLLLLAEERRLHLDDPVSKHLPWLAGFGPKVTLRRLLHHTSGIRDLYDDEGADEVLARCERPTNVDLVRIYADLGCPMASRRTEPGDVFAYSNSGYDLLGAVIEAVSRQSYRDFFKTRVFDLLKMKDTFSVPDRRAGGRRCATGYMLDDRGDLSEHGGTEFDDLVGSGSFYSTASDLILYEHALATNAVVSAASMREALTSGRTNDGAQTHYGFGWFVGDDNGAPMADHEGAWAGFHAYIRRYLATPLSIYVLSNHPTIDLVEIARVAATAYRWEQSV